MDQYDDNDDTEDITAGLDEVDIAQETPRSKEVREFWRTMTPSILRELEEWHEEGDKSVIENTAGYRSPKEDGIIRVVAKNYTYEKLRQRLSSVYNLPVLFNGKDDATIFVLKEQGPPSGSYAYVHKVDLKKPLEITFDVAKVDGTPGKVTWKCDQIAVKEIFNNSSKEPYIVCNRVVREIRVWSRLRHERIVPLLGLWVDFCRIQNNAEYFVPHPVPVSPWFPEGNLNLYLARKPNATQVERLTFLRDIASAMKYMHSMNAVHGDLRADNILVKDAHAYISDFGVARDIVRGHTTEMPGNVRYWAHERYFPQDGATDPEVATTMSDVYEFAFVCLEVWTGRVPWHNIPKDGQARIILERAAGRNPPKPNSMYNNFWRFLEDCWQIQPKYRPTAATCLEEIKGFLDEYLRRERSIVDRSSRSQRSGPAAPGRKTRGRYEDDDLDESLVDQNERLKGKGVNDVSSPPAGPSDSNAGSRKPSVWSRLKNAVTRDTSKD